MTRPLRLLPVLLLLAACADPDHPPASAAQKEAAEAGDLKLSTRLNETIRAARATPPCAAVVAGEWPTGFPVPAEGSRGRRFKIFFYPMSGAQGEPTISSPAAEALLDIDAGKAVSCALAPGKPQELPGRRWPAALDGVGAFQQHALMKKLHDRTEAAAAVYGGQGVATPADVEAAKDYVRLFKLNAEPALLPYYYRLNPAFWEWLRETAGDSIPPAR